MQELLTFKRQVIKRIVSDCLMSVIKHEIN